MTVARAKLYEEVWAEPMTKVAARHEVSASFLARVCERLNVPRPPRGYWARLAFGKVDPRPALPEARPGDDQAWTKGGPLPVQRWARPKPPREPASPAKGEMDRDRPHPLITGARERFKPARVERYGVGYLRPYKRRLVDVFVTEQMLVPALGVARQLFTHLEHAGHRVTFAPADRGHFRRPELNHREPPAKEASMWDRWSPDRPTVVYVGTVAIGLTLFEVSEEVEVVWIDDKPVRVDSQPSTRRRRHQFERAPRLREMPSGRLGLRAYSPYPGAQWERRWIEARAGDLQTMFEEVERTVAEGAVIVAQLVAEAERQAELERQEWEAQRRKWAREEAERKTAAAYKASRDELLGLVEQWALVKRIEGFFAEVAQSAEGVDDAARVELAERLHCAREMLGGTNALDRLRSWRSPEERR